MDTNKEVNWKTFLVKWSLLFLSALTTVKVIWFGVDVDEEYAIAMSYRMAAGDGMFAEMWELLFEDENLRIEKVNGKKETECLPYVEEAAQ